MRYADRGAELLRRRNLKMAKSAHAYVRGSTASFYEWLDGPGRPLVPEGPAIWICGDCHVGNFGPVADLDGHVEIVIRDLDQTVIGNPAHDLIRLGLSLATAARGSDLPGATTAHMLEQIVDGYASVMNQRKLKDASEDQPKTLDQVLQLALRRRWKHLARERIEGVAPSIPLGKRFWPLSRQETKAISAAFAQPPVHQLLTCVRKRDDDSPVRLLDAAYWMKGCSSLGKLRYAVLAGVGPKKQQDFCLVDFKEAVKPVPPRAARGRMPRDNALRVVQGARALSPGLGRRMRPARLLGHALVVRELFPQDLKLEIDRLTRSQAMQAARSLAEVLGRAHARQLTVDERRAWAKVLLNGGTKNLDAPSWLWKAVVGLMGHHEVGYLEHCRRHLAEL